MTLSLLFLILYVVAIVIFIYRNRNADLYYILEYLLLWVLIGILGYVTFDGFSDKYYAVKTRKRKYIVQYQ